MSDEIPVDRLIKDDAEGRARLKGSLLSTLKDPIQSVPDLSDYVVRSRVSRLAKTATEIPIVRELSELSDTQIHISKYSEQLSILEGKATLLTDVTVGGMVHISPQRIESFSIELSGKYSGKFGHGTYFGLGPLEGESFDLLAREQSRGEFYKHIVQLSGNFLLVTQAEVLVVEKKLREILGLPINSRYKTTISNAPLVDLMQQFSIRGLPIDGVIVILTKNQHAAEVVVSPKSCPKIEITG